jgi:hypothetical protein
MKNKVQTASSPLAQLKPGDQHKLFTLLNSSTPARVRDLIAQPAPEGFGLTVSIEQIEQWASSVNPADLWFQLELTAETAAAIAQEYHRHFDNFNKAITLTLMKHTLHHLNESEINFTYVKLYHGLLVNHLKLGITAAAQQVELTPQQKQERLWDIFCIPEEERVRRRAKALNGPQATQVTINQYK